MSYEDVSQEITTPMPTTNKRQSDGITYMTLQPRSTERVDHCDGSSLAPEELTYSNVADDVEGAIGPVTTRRPDSGSSFTYVLETGNEDGDFTITHGLLYRTDEHVLDGGPYTLGVRISEAGPLYRWFNVEITVTVAA